MSDADPIVAAVEHAHHVLPDQGPIGVFVHHNTLHAFQHLSFHDGVQQGAATLHAKPYLYLEQFRQAWKAGRVEDKDIDVEIDAEFGAGGDAVLALCLRRRALWRALMVEDVVQRRRRPRLCDRLRQHADREDAPTVARLPRPRRARSRAAPAKARAACPPSRCVGHARRRRHR